MDIESLEVLLSFALAHGNINHIIDVIMALMGVVKGCGLEGVV